MLVSRSVSFEQMPRIYPPTQGAIVTTDGFLFGIPDRCFYVILGGDDQPASWGPGGTSNKYPTKSPKMARNSENHTLPDNLISNGKRIM